MWFINKFFITTAHAEGILGNLGDSNANMATLGDLGTLIINIMNLVFAISGGVAAIMIFYGAFQLFIAGGDTEKAKKAKTTITAALVGAAIIVLSAFLVRVFVELLGGRV